MKIHKKGHSGKNGKNCWKLQKENNSNKRQQNDTLDSTNQPLGWQRTQTELVKNMD